jgi:hypothetical protein
VSKTYFRGSETFLGRSAKTMLDPSRVVMSCSCLYLCVDNANVSLILRSMFRTVKALRWLSKPSSSQDFDISRGVVDLMDTLTRRWGRRVTSEAGGYPVPF